MLTALSNLMTSGNGVNLLTVMIIIPAVMALLVLIIPKRSYLVQAVLFLLATLANLLFAIALFFVDEMTMLIPWAGFEINLALRIYDFSQLMILIAACFVLLVGLYTISFVRNQAYSGQFFFYYLITLAMVNGTFLANNMVVMLFFWEGLLVTLFGMIIIGNKDKPAAAVKALILNGTADLLLMFGVGITCMQAGTMMMDVIADVPMDNIGTLGFICMMLGAAGKAGAIPFHSWIPDAAQRAPLPFMAIMPAVLEKMLGVYLLARITLDFYDFQPGGAMSILVMSIGAVTILFAVAMSLIQKDIKRLLSFQAIGQVGYIILGLGTAIPAGIVGGLFHMINHVIYKCCLFLTAGSVEKQTGTTDMAKLGGLGRFMPVTAICFIIAALAACGVPPFSAFFSKELVFDAAWEGGIVFYVIAVLGAFLTAACFLRLGHTVFFGKAKLPAKVQTADVGEAPGAMLLPMIILAGFCVLFGVWNSLPLSLIQPLAFTDLSSVVDFSGWPHSFTLVMISIIVLLFAALNHYFGFRHTGSALKSVDHIHYLPIVHQLYNGAERHYFDPYDILMMLIRFLAYICYSIDRCIDWIYNVLIVKVITGASAAMKSFNTGSISRYISWMFSGVALLLLMFILMAKGGVN